MKGSVAAVVQCWRDRGASPQALRWLVWRLLITVVLAMMLFQLGRYQSYGGDGAFIARLAGTDWTILYHLYLTSIMHRVFYLIFSPLDFSAWECVSISSSVAGALAIQVLVGYSRNPLFLIPNLCAGSFLVFVGQVEAYAWVNLFLLVTLIEAQRTLEQNAPVWRLMACWCIAASFHLMALFYLLPVMWILRKRQPFAAWEFGAPLGAFLACYFVASQAMPSTGFEMDMRRLVPLFETSRPDHWFLFFSTDHLEIKLYFLVYAGIFFWPIGWPIVMLLWRRINIDYTRYLLANAVLGLMWFIVWHPDLGWIDWDLFSQPGIPLHFLVGVLLVRLFR